MYSNAYEQIFYCLPLANVSVEIQEVFENYKTPTVRTPESN